MISTYNENIKRLSDLEGNYWNRNDFQNKIEKLLLYFISKENPLHQVGVQRPIMLNNHFAKLNGNWVVYLNPQHTKNSGSANNWEIDNTDVRLLTGETIGQIDKFNFIENYSILYFSIAPLGIGKNRRIFSLIFLTSNEMIGFCDGSYCHMKRHE